VLIYNKVVIINQVRSVLVYNKVVIIIISSKVTLTTIKLKNSLVHLPLNHSKHVNKSSSNWIGFNTRHEDMVKTTRMLKCHTQFFHTVLIPLHTDIMIYIE